MSRIDPLRGRLGRRDLLKVTGAAAGVAALGDLPVKVLPLGARTLARTRRTRSSSASAPTSMRLDPARLTPRKATSPARISTTVSCSTISARPPSDPGWPNHGRSPRTVWSTRSTSGRVSTSMTARPSTPTPWSPGTTRLMRAPDSQYDATRMVYIADFITDWSTLSKRSTSLRFA